MNDRRKKKTLRYYWNGNFIIKAVIVLIPIIVTCVLAWGSWATLSIAKTPEVFATKSECETAQKKDQEARDRLEKRLCDRISRTEDRFELILKTMQEQNQKLGEIKGEIKGIRGGIDH